MKKYGLSAIFHHSCLNVKTEQEENTAYLIVEIFFLRARVFGMQYNFLLFFFLPFFFPYFFFLRAYKNRERKIQISRIDTFFSGNLEKLYWNVFQFNCNRCKFRNRNFKRDNESGKLHHVTPFLSPDFLP